MRKNYGNRTSSTRQRATSASAPPLDFFTGEWLARGTWSSGSQIRVRLYTWNADELLDEAMLRRRIARAVAARAALPQSMRAGNAQRLVFAESDGLPGLIVDRYGEYLVVQ